MGAALEVRGVSKTFGTTKAVDDLHLVVPRGQTCGVIGPSGAGKTTAIRMIMSILFPDRGTLAVLGHKSALEAKDRIGYLPEERGVYQKMRVGAFLTYIAGLKGVEEDVAVQRAERLLEQLGLTDMMKKKCEDLSKGMLQRVQFVASIINEPDLLILDEPFSGLDPVSVRMMKAVLAAEHLRGATILLSTHVMAHAEELCEHVVMLHKGRKVLDEPMSGLRRQFDTRSVRLEALDPDADFSTLLGLPGVELVTRTADGCSIRLADGTDPAAAIRSLASVVAPARIELARVRLEDVFVRLVTEVAGTDDSEALRSHLQGLNADGAA